MAYHEVTENTKHTKALRYKDFVSVVAFVSS